MLEKKCLHCGKFFPKPKSESKKDWENRHKFCSRICRYDSMRMEIKICAQCEANPVKRVGKVYCSKKCYWETRKGPANNKWKGGLIEKVCVVCQKHFSIRRYREKTAIFCSKRCSDIAKRGTSFSPATQFKRKSPITTRKILVEAIVKCPQYVHWRRDIYERDNHTCVICEVRGGKLNCDHFPRTFSSILDTYKIDTLEKAVNCKDLWDIGNGRTLCKSCHIQTPTYGRHKRNRWNSSLV